MSPFTYEDITPSLIPNTTMRKVLEDGVHKAYYLKAIDGYVLHDKARDWTDIDPVTMEETEYHRGYTRAEASCWNDYDFTTSQITIDDGTIVTAYGEREFFAIPDTDVPADNIFGTGNNHETI